VSILRENTYPKRSRQKTVVRNKFSRRVSRKKGLINLSLGMRGEKRGEVTKEGILLQGESIYLKRGLMSEKRTETGPLSGGSRGKVRERDRLFQTRNQRKPRSDENRGGAAHFRKTQV